MSVKWIACGPLLFALLFFPAALLAEDAEGCKDSSLIARVPGSTIDKCGHQERRQATMSVRKGKDVVEQTVEGDYYSWGYVTRNGATDAEVYQAIKDSLAKAGFQIDFEAEPDRLTAHKGDTWYGLENRGDYYKQIMLTVKAK